MLKKSTKEQTFSRPVNKTVHGGKSSTSCIIVSHRKDDNSRILQISPRFFINVPFANSNNLEIPRK